MTTLAEYTDEVLTELWRPDDAELRNAMPLMFQRATARVRRDVELPSISTTEIITIVDQKATTTLPQGRSPIKAIFRSYGSAYVQSLNYLEPREFVQQLRDDYPYDIAVTARSAPLYTIINNTIHAHVPDNTALTVVYNGSVEPIFDTSAGANDGFQTRHPDFYLSAVCYFCSRFLREGDMAAYYDAEYMKALESVIAYERNLLYNNAGIQPMLPGIVA